MRRWFRLLNRRKRMMEDLDQDIRDFIERETQDNIDRGMPPEEARYAALRKFGNVTRVKEETREVWTFVWLEQLWQDVRVGLRQLRRSPGFTTVAVLTLALGIGANTAIFSLIDSVMLRMLPVVKPDDLLQVKTRIPQRPGEPSGAFTNRLWGQVRAQQDVFSDVFAWGEASSREDSLKFDLGQGGTIHSAHGLWVSGSFFGALGLRPAAGRLITPPDDQRGCRGVAVLSYGFWQEHYGGDERAIGASLLLGGHPFAVMGVAPSGFYGMEVGDKFDVALPICAAALFDEKESRLDDRSWWWLQIVGRIKPGMSRAQVSARLAALSPGIFSAALPQDWSPAAQRAFVKRTLFAVPAATGVSEYGLREQFGTPLDILMAIVGAVLLIACANIASLMLARAVARHKEMAVRQALGASRTRLVRQLLTECILLSSAGGLLGIVSARWGSAVLVHSISTTRSALFLDLSPDSRILSFTALAAVTTGILFGLLPALRSTRISLTSAMKGSQAMEIGRSLRFHTRKWIIASQVALSFVLLVTAGLLLRSFAKLVTLDLGFDRSSVLLVSTDLQAARVAPDRQPALGESIETILGALPGVTSVGRSFWTPMEGGAWSQPIATDWSKDLSPEEAETWMNAASPGYFAALRMPLLAGRTFASTDTATSPRVAIVNQTLARRFFPGQNPLGRVLRVQQPSGEAGPPIEVVGLVKDSKYEFVSEDTHPTAFFPISQFPARAARPTFELRTSIRPSALLLAVQSAISGVDKGIPLEIHTLAEQVDDSIVQEHLLALLSGFFGALALLLAVVGLYGTFNYLVTQRQGEFGIRMALGAARASILRLVMRDLVAVLAGGLAAGILISLAATRLLQRMLFGLGPRDTITMLLAAGVLSAVALIAGYLPARRATKVDPMVALRYE
jgi:predicted permease